MKVPLFKPREEEKNQSTLNAFVANSNSSWTANKNIKTYSVRSEAKLKSKSKEIFKPKPKRVADNLNGSLTPNSFLGMRRNDNSESFMLSNMDPFSEPTSGFGNYKREQSYASVISVSSAGPDRKAARKRENKATLKKFKEKEKNSVVRSSTGNLVDKNDMSP